MLLMESRTASMGNGINWENQVMLSSVILQGDSGGDLDPQMEWNLHGFVWDVQGLNSDHHRLILESSLIGL